MQYKILKDVENVNELEGINLFLEKSQFLKHNFNIVLNLPSHDITLQALFLLLKEIWKDSDYLIKHQFPMINYGTYEIEIWQGWDITENSTKYLHKGELKIEKTGVIYSDLMVSTSMKKTEKEEV